MNEISGSRRKRVFDIIEVGNDLDFISRGYDFLNAFAIVLNLTVSIMYTFSDLRAQHGALLLTLEHITIAFFFIDYLLRLWTARYLYPGLTEGHAVRRYALSFTGLIDLLSFLPYYLPFFFPAGAAAFRLIRIIRIFRLFRINAYYDSLNVITEVLISKKQQLISSVFIILVLMTASSLCMYSLEHAAQPEVFENAFSGIWWATSTLLTVGYGDIYPITTMGKLLGIFISFLGVGMVAIPTGIISAGFVDQYSSIKKNSEYGKAQNMNFLKIYLEDMGPWTNSSICSIKLPDNLMIIAIKRRSKLLLPKDDLILQTGDQLILGAEPFNNHENINLKEIQLQKKNPWTGLKINELNLPRHSHIVLIKRRGKILTPNENFLLREGDILYMYTQLHLSDATIIEI